MPSGDNITTKFKVDISDLKKGITEANQQIKLANAQFKAASAGMDDWGKSTDGVKAKLNQLESVLASEKAKLSAYEQELKRNEDAYEENGKVCDELRAKLKELADQGVSKTSKEYKTYEKALTDAEKEQNANKKAVDNLNITVLNQKAAVNKTEADIKKYNATLDKLEDEETGADKAAEDLEKSVEDTGKAAEKSEGGFTVLKGALADLVSAGIQKAVQGLKDLASGMYDAWQAYDEGADAIIAVTGATGEAAEELVGVYENVSRNVIGDFNDIGQAVGEVSTRFGLTGDALEETSEQFLKFAELNKVDVKTAIDSTQSAMDAFDVSVEDTGDFLDMLNKVGQDTGASLDSLTQAMVTNAPQLQELGFGASDAAAFLGELDKSGADTSAVLGGLKKALQNATKEGKPMSEAVSEIQDSIKNADSEVEAFQKSSEIFGAKAGPAIAKAVREGKLSFDQFGTSLGDFRGNLDTTYNAMLDGPDKVKLAMQNLKLETAKVFDTFLQEHGPQIEKMVGDFTTNTLPKLMEMLSSLMNGVSFLADNLPVVVGLLASLAAGVGTYVAYTTALMIIEKGWKSIAIVQKAVTAGQAALNAVMALNPVGIVIAAIVALVAAFVILWNKSETFRNFWIGLWEAIKTAAVPVIEAIVQWFSQAWDNIQSAWSGAAAWFLGVWEGVKKAFATADKWFREKFTAAWNAIKSAWSVVVAWFLNVWNGIKNVFATVDAWFREKFTAAWNAVKAAWANAVSFFQNIWDGIKGVFSGIVGFFKEQFTAAFNAIKEAFSGWESFWGELWEKIKKGFTDIGVKIGDAMSGAVKSAINKVIAQAENTVNKAIGLINSAIDVINKLPGVSVGKIATVSFPRLERGGILRRGQVGLLEGSGAEAVVPLDKNKLWIRAVAREMARELKAAQMMNVASGDSKNPAVASFTQNIYAPKQPSRIELYRQTQNLLNLARYARGYV